MKMRSVLAAAAAAAVVSCAPVCAFAESADVQSTSAEAASEISAANSETGAAESKIDNTSVISAVSEAADPIDKNNPGTGVKGVAAVAGVVIVAGAALTISHKREH